MPLPEQTSRFSSAPMDEVLTVLLRQLKRPLAGHNITLNDADITGYVQDRLANRHTESPLSYEGLRGAFQAIIQESEAVLAAWNLNFADSLNASMNDIPGWQSTAEFLDLAERKSNAELRIALASALALALCEDRQYVPHLLALADGDYAEETDIARRALCFAAHIDPAAPDWRAQVRRWVEGEGI